MIQLHNFESVIDFHLKFRIYINESISLHINQIIQMLISFFVWYHNVRERKVDDRNDLNTSIYDSSRQRRNQLDKRTITTTINVSSQSREVKFMIFLAMILAAVIITTKKIVSVAFVTIESDLLSKFERKTCVFDMSLTKFAFDLMKYNKILTIQ